MRLVAFCLFVLTLPVPAAAEPRLEAGFDHYYNLEYDQALDIFRALAREAPEEPTYLTAVAQAILYRELFRVGALESELVSGSNSFLRRSKVQPSEADQQEFEHSIARAIEITEKSLAADKADLEALYVQGVAHGLRANYDFLVRKAWMDALRSATKSRRMHARVLKLDPKNVDARMIPAVHEYVVGSLPWHIRVISLVTGFSGDKEGGIATLEVVARDGGRNRQNAQILLCAVYRRERRPRAAIPLLRQLIKDFPRNYLLRMEMVQMYSDLGEKDKGMEVVREMEKLTATAAPGYDRMPESKLWYTRGTLLFWYLDLEPARADFQRMVAVEDKMTLHSAQLAWYRLGQTNDLLGHRDEALKSYRKVIDMAPDSERAQQARQYLKQPCTKDNRK